MLSEKVRAFLRENNRGILTAFRKSKAAQMSIVSCGLYRDGAAFTTTADRAKLINLKRNPKCSLLVSQPNWWGYVVLEGRAELLSPGVAYQEELRLSLRDATVRPVAESIPTGRSTIKPCGTRPARWLLWRPSASTAPPRKPAEAILSRPCDADAKDQPPGGGSRSTWIKPYFAREAL